MIGCRTLKPTKQFRSFLCRHHRQSNWRMAHQNTRRMQQNGFRWYCLYLRARRETLFVWARSSRDGYAACVEARNRLPSNDDTPRSFVYWHLANVYARIGMGEDKEIVIPDEEAQLLTKIRAYNTAQEKIIHTWHGYAGYYGKDEVRTKMLHARHRITAAGF